MTFMNPAPPAQALCEEAVGLHKAGRSAEAELLYRRALAAQPDHPEANHNLGILLIQRGELAAALGHFRIALSSDPSRDLYWLSLARAQLIAGEPAQAAATLAQGRAHGLAGPAADALAAQVGETAPAPEPKDLLKRGDALAEAGRLDEAEAAWREALARDPDLAEAHYHLGSVLSETGRIAEGFAHLMRRAEIVRGADDPTAGGAGGPRHKVKHDREQKAFLVERGIVAADAPDPVFHLGEGTRLDGRAVNPANATPELFARWRAAAPQLVVIDDFLTSEALAKLRA
jgi:tetratricopeptide (TPR) repeat protein